MHTHSSSSPCSYFRTTLRARTLTRQKSSRPQSVHKSRIDTYLNGQLLSPPTGVPCVCVFLLPHCDSLSYPLQPFLTPRPLCFYVHVFCGTFYCAVCERFSAKQDTHMHIIRAGVPLGASTRLHSARTLPRSDIVP